MLDFLREVGKHITVNQMMAQGVGEEPARERDRHLVHRVQLHAAPGERLPSSCTRTHGVELQMGGSDQWGNITAGIDLIRKTAGGVCPRAHLAAVAEERRHEVRQDRRRRGLARPRQDEPVPVPPVLAAGRRRRDRRLPPAVLDPPARRGAGH